jgi:hypothetical protein
MMTGGSHQAASIPATTRELSTPRPGKRFTSNSKDVGIDFAWLSYDALLHRWHRYFFM